MFLTILKEKKVPDVYVKINYNDVIHGMNVFLDMAEKRRHLLEIGFNLDLVGGSPLPVLFVSKKKTELPILRVSLEEIMGFHKDFKNGLVNGDGALVPCIAKN